MSKLSRSVFSFGVIGVLATVTHVAVFSVLVELGLATPVAASIPAFLAALVISYFANHHWTFDMRGAHIKHMPRFTLVSVLGLGLNTLITYVVVDVWGGWYGFALAAVILVVPAVTFLLNRHWTYAKAEI